MEYRHLEVDIRQKAKKPGTVCGDVVCVDRRPAHTLLLCSDGLGSGVKANLAATMCVARLRELIRGGYSLREAVAAVVRTMDDARTRDLPYAVFTAVQMLPDGSLTALSYEMPPPLLLTRHMATVLAQRTITVERSVIRAGHAILDVGDAIAVVSDGVTYAGLGAGFPEGWGTDGMVRHANHLLSHGISLADLAGRIERQACDYWGRQLGDDVTTAVARCRRGKVVNVFTGPPVDRAADAKVAHRFAQTAGEKVVCGGTTAKIVADALGRGVEVSQEHHSAIEPPRYAIEGIGIVTEGAVTLNQVYNLLEEDPCDYEKDSVVGQLCTKLNQADRINFFVGRAPNLAGGDIAFRQQGILPRTTIVPLLAQKLEDKAKLVVIEYF